MPLYDQCVGRPENECLDNNAECNDARCLCKNTHFDKNGVCGKYQCKYPLVIGMNILRIKCFIRKDTKSNKITNKLKYSWISFSVPKIPLSFPCDFGDICLTQNAECRGGICQCVDTYYPRQQQCSEYFHNC